MSTATAPPPPPPRFLTLFWNSAHRHNLCTVTLLAWLSACDGTIDPKEAAFVRRILAAGGNVEDFDVIFQVAQAARIDDLEVACRYVTTHFTRGQKRLFAQLAITLAAQDGHITVGENYALQFLADLLDIRPRAFSKLFQQVTHRPFPEAGDPSTIEWWQRREAGVQAEPAEGLGADEPQRTTTGSASQQLPPVEPAAGPMTRTHALYVFGLADGATSDQVRSAFRRLAKVRHPDRFAKLGPAAIAAATESFRQLEEAYVLLKA